ncbi:PREDICTED: probable xyloglucan endotransglucosylase/hydrolase protein 10 [Tarenaya hassleriana]|uniref:probable xyloglucan endotransglucosylase/hydrolase protein 10 n=1 Tax=Tarenaya hassleriana TaxID=28532 RepID=UPI00053C8D2F|nr:PREDICTED: probable xyloglucan endotransglucosylase/hydrolase protein 10 [Tarenaya hassleriana]
MALNCLHLLAIIGFLVANLLPMSLSSVVSTGDFDKDFFVTWSPSHVNTSNYGRSRTLKLDQESGASFASNQMFLFGQIDMKIKLIPGDSAGTVVAYYISSDQPNRDEIDFEFLGNVSGQPYILQTNIYADGSDNREERIYLWFDPTKDFHTYSILWNIHQIVFFVDQIPIRVYRNHTDKGVAFPRRQPMSVKASLWNGDSWATRGGRDKVDWSKGPFLATFGDYKIDACVWRGNPRFCRERGEENWWNKDEFSSLTRLQKRWFKWVRKYHMIYDYCQDHQRFHDNLPKECSLPNY